MFCTLATAGWTSGTTFTISGVVGVTLVSQTVDNATQAYLVVTTTTVALGSAQTLTISDGTNSGTTSVAPIAPTHRRYFPGLFRRCHS